jgi:hypothetical protein
MGILNWFKRKRNNHKSDTERKDEVIDIMKKSAESVGLKFYDESWECPIIDCDGVVIFEDNDIKDSFYECSDCEFVWKTKEEFLKEYIFK